jgi:hypothetical protein
VPVAKCRESQIDWFDAESTDVDAAKEGNKALRPLAALGLNHIYYVGKRRPQRLLQRRRADFITMSLEKTIFFAGARVVF